MGYRCEWLFRVCDDDHILLYAWRSACGHRLADRLSFHSSFLQWNRFAGRSIHYGRNNGGNHHFLGDLDAGDSFAAILVLRSRWWFAVRWFHRTRQAGMEHSSKCSHADVAHHLLTVPDKHWIDGRIQCNQLKRNRFSAVDLYHLHLLPGTQKSAWATFASSPLDLGQSWTFHQSRRSGLPPHDLDLPLLPNRYTGRRSNDELEFSDLWRHYRLRGRLLFHLWQEELRSARRTGLAGARYVGEMRPSAFVISCHAPTISVIHRSRRY